MKPGANGYGNLAVARGRFENDRLSNVQEIFHANAPGNGTNRSSMWGGRIAFDKSGYLFITLGDRQWPAVGDLTAHPGAGPADAQRQDRAPARRRPRARGQPVRGQAGRAARDLDLGHRNAQGMAVHPDDRRLWQNEHGPQGGDELNLIRARPELRLAGDRLRRELHDRARHPRRHARRRALSRRRTCGCRRSACRA